MIKSALRAINYTSSLRNFPLSKYYFSSPKTPFTSTSKDDLDQLTTNQHISKNIGLQRFLQKVYNTTALSILGSLGTSCAVLSLPISASGMSMLAGCGMVAGLVGIIGSSFMKPTVSVVYEQLNSREKA